MVILLCSGMLVGFPFISTTEPVNLLTIFVPPYSPVYPLITVCVCILHMYEQVHAYVETRVKCQVSCLSYSLR